jgi:hypothetical protein
VLGGACGLLQHSGTAVFCALKCVNLLCFQQAVCSLYMGAGYSARLMTCVDTHADLQVSDPYWEDVSCYGYQSLQPHQDSVIQAAEQQLEKLRSAIKARAHKHSTPNTAR